METFFSRNEIYEAIAGCCNELIFTYNGKPSGVTSEVHDSKPTFQVWHGEDVKYYTDANEVMTDRFYSGRSIEELIGKVDFQII